MTDLAAQGKFRVLLVDDEENVLKSLKRLFMDEEFEIITAASGREGLEAVRENEIAVILSDQKMPEMNGAEFLEKSRETSPDSVRLILTGYADVNAAIAAINKGGASRYLSKPWDDNNLLATVREAVERYRLVKENAYLTELTRKQNEELRIWNTQLETIVQEQTIDITNQNKALRKLNEQLSKNFKSSIGAFSGLIEMRDKSTSNHSRNVAALARQTAAAMALPEKEISNIVVAALLHDIGKIGIPDAIFARDEDSLAGDERKEYELHPVRGQVAVEVIEGFTEIGVLIRHHHEAADGQGFPDRLKKNQIPAGSRILAIADYVDKLANGRFSKTRNDYKKALKEVEFYLDTKFDRTIFKFMRPSIEEKIRALEGLDYSNELEINYAKLEPGMILSRDFKSGTGMLLLVKGSILDEKVIHGLKRYYQIDSPKTGIFILKNSVAARSNV